MTAAVIGALYAVLTMVLAPISYGPVQCRISEVLCILPFFMPSTTWGLFFGCAIANIASSAGLPDIIFGSLATLIACLCISWCGKHNKKALACLMPVIWNGLIVGAMLTVVVAGLNPIKNFGAFAVFAGEVALGEAAVMFIAGYQSRCSGVSLYLHKAHMAPFAMNEWFRTPCHSLLSDSIQP